MNIYQRLNAARADFHALQLKKTGHNKFAGYNYFELGDFLIPALRIFKEHGITAVVSFEVQTAAMRLVNSEDPADCIVITSPMGSAALKGCHEVQNIGAVETYQRRYLWVAALEIVEHDALDASTGKTDKPDAGGVISAPVEAYKGLTPDWQQWVDVWAADIANAFEQLGVSAAQELIDEAVKRDKLDPNVQAAVFAKLDSKTRAALKKGKNELRNARLDGQALQE